MKIKTKKNRKKMNIQKGVEKGNSKYAKKKELQRKGIYSTKSPFYSSN